MHPGKTLTLLTFLSFFFASCKKDNNDASPISDDDCAQQLTAADDPSGRYIITYANTPQGRSNGLTTLEMADKSVLGRNAIQDGSYIASFAGEPGGFIARLNETEVQQLKKDQQIAIVEPDRIIKLNTCFSVAEPRLITWNIHRVGYGDGTGKTAWIIDSGIDFTHPDLTVDAGRSRSFLNGNSSARDENGHGTHVAGIIAGKNNTIGVLGVASGATVVSLRVLDKNGEGLLSSIVQALSWVNANGSAGDVVNMSVGDEDGGSETLDQQVKSTASRGIYFAIAAGNEKKPANIYSPARVNGLNIYTVSAIDSLDRFASFSNYGNDVVDYAVPGVKILSTYLNGKYAYMSGTSMAAPHMAGLLLLKGNNIKTDGTARNDPDGTPDPIAHY